MVGIMNRQSLTIFLDLDGVLANLVSAAIKAHGRNDEHSSITQWSMAKLWGISDKEFWKPLQGSAFWENIEPYSHAVEFYDELCDLGRLYICTSPNSDPECPGGKIRWIKKYLGTATRNVILTSHKHLLSGPNKILIDDKPENIDSFINHGGSGILFKQPWNQGLHDWKQCLNLVKNWAHFSSYEKVSNITIKNNRLLGFEQLDGEMK